MADAATHNITQAICPYCDKRASVRMSRLGDHRVNGSYCDGSAKEVLSIDHKGRAVISMANERVVSMRIGLLREGSGTTIWCDSSEKPAVKRALDAAGLTYKNVSDGLFSSDDFQKVNAALYAAGLRFDV